MNISDIDAAVQTYRQTEQRKLGPRVDAHPAWRRSEVLATMSADLDQRVEAYARSLEQQAEPVAPTKPGKKA